MNSTRLEECAASTLGDLSALVYLSLFKIGAEFWKVVSGWVPIVVLLAIGFVFYRRSTTKIKTYEVVEEEEVAPRRRAKSPSRRREYDD